MEVCFAQVSHIFYFDNFEKQSAGNRLPMQPSLFLQNTGNGSGSYSDFSHVI